VPCISQPDGQNKGKANMNIHIQKLSVCAIALLFLTLGAPAYAEPMTHDEIKAALTGKTFTYSGPSSGTVGYSADGTSSITYTYKGKKKSKTGSWWVDGDKLCTKQTRKGSKGKETTQCQTLTSLGGGKIESDSGYTLAPQ
jgi:hypothetical protein